MAENYRVPYEISVWDDVLTTEYYAKINIEGHEISEPWGKEAIKYCEDHNLNFYDTFNVVQYFNEEMVAIIGSDTMDTPIRAMDPSFKRNVNGTTTLSFYIYLKYYDEETDEIKDNPFISLLVNERKLKVKYDNEWFDCIIKDIEEDSNEMKMKITACDQHINELSKTGFNIEFNTELKNNIGTAIYFGEKIVDGTDWIINTDMSSTLIERQEEPLYEITLSQSVEAVDLVTGALITIPSESKIYSFYSQIIGVEDNNKTSIQIIYKEDGEYYTDNNHMLILDNFDDPKYNTSQYLVNNVQQEDETHLNIGIYVISSRYRGKRLIESPKVEYDPVTDRVVTVYNDTSSKNPEYIPISIADKSDFLEKLNSNILYISYIDDSNNTHYRLAEESDYSQSDDIPEQIFYQRNNAAEYQSVYGYTETTYDVSNIVTNYIYNASNYPNAEGWHYGQYTSDIVRHLIYRTIPDTKNIRRPEDPFVESDIIHDVLNFSNGHWYLNDGITQNFSKTTGFSKGDKYVFRVSAGREVPSVNGVVNDYVVQPEPRYPASTPTALGSYKVTQNNPQYFRAKIQDYKIDTDGKIEFGDTYFSFSYANKTDSNDHIFQASVDEKNRLFPIKLNNNYYYFKDKNGNYTQLKSNTPGVSLEGNFYVYSGESSIYEKKYANDYKYVIGTCTKPLAYSKMLSGVREDKNGKKTTGWKVGIFICAPSEYEYVPIGTKIYPNTVQYYKYNTSTQKYTKVPKSQLLIDGNGKTTVEYWRDVDYYVEDIQIFEYQPDGDSFLEPGDAPTSAKYTKYFYYIPETDLTKKAEDIEYLYQGFDKQSQYVPQQKDNIYEKVRTITSKESNRYNLIQSICELFECWARFDVNRDPDTGKILLEKIIEDGQVKSLRQEKSITFLPYIGDYNYAGFKYGINLNSIQRSLDSSAIVTKLIVKANSNQHATNGFCTIQRAEDNPIKAEFILNPQYYFNQGLLDPAEWLADLTNNQNGHLGFYKQMRESNKKLQELNLEKTNLNTILARLKAQDTAYKSIYEGSIENQQKIIDRIKTATSTTDEEKAVNKLKDLVAKDNPDSLYRNLLTQYESNKLNAKQVNPERERVYEEILRVEYQIENIDDEIKAQNDIVKDIEARFYKKYARYIQEGSWISEDYIDDNLYFLDAENVLYTSAFPQVSYTINVLDLGELDEYKGYHYNVGDKTYIEDTEFFGYSFIDGLKTPYQEEVVLTETTDYFDAPERNTITVQNYKTQFEDLFQRITATTQSLQYASGEYNKSAGLLNTDGTIKPDRLQNSITNTSVLLSNAANQSVVIGEDGITTTNLSNPLEVVRISSGVIAISKDGGTNWTTGVSASGISTSALTTGQIDVSKISVSNGNYPTFVWDNNGISAFAYSQEGVDYGKFIRHDQFGLYGVNGTDGLEWVAKDIPDIENKASFGFVWDEFFLKSNHNNGMVKISSNDDIQVIANDKERIKIGLLDEATDLYGIKINNDKEETVMKTGSDGNLWLNDTLYVGGEDSLESNVRIGYNKTVTREDSEYHEVIHAGDGNNNFIVYEDGYIKANGGSFTGTINATGGKIGNLSIEEMEEKMGAVIELGDDIKMIAGNANLTFNKDGLEVRNGGLEIMTDRYVLYLGSQLLDASYLIYEGDINGKQAVYEYNSLTDSYELTEDQERQKEKTYYINENQYYEFDSNTGGYSPTSDTVKIEGKEYYVLGLDNLVFYVNEKTGELVLDGNIYAKDSYFEGTVYAKDGDFTGSIYANDGTLGNMDIVDKLRVGDNIIIDGSEGVISSSNFSEENNSGFQLSKEGKIIANDISLGIGAEIKNYLWIGDNKPLNDGTDELHHQNGGWIFNPTLNAEDMSLTSNGESNNIYSNGDVFVIESDNKKAISLNSKGEMNLYKNGVIRVSGSDGDTTSGIVISGDTKSIYAGKPGNEVWQITPQRSVFNNIEAKGSIKATVFEYGSIQTIGGMIVIRPSTKIIDASINESDNQKIDLYLENVQGFKQYDICKIGSDDENNGYVSTEYYRIENNIEEIKIETRCPNLTEKTGHKITINYISSDISVMNNFIKSCVNQPIINMMSYKTFQDEEQEYSEENTIGIGLNSSNNGAFISPTSLSVFSTQPEKEGEQIRYKQNNHIILGLLSESQIKNFFGNAADVTNRQKYGLYADNVLINGAMIAKSQGSYAGIDTLCDKTWTDNEKNLYNFNNTGEYIFWAGTTEDLGQSEFRLDKKGNLFANSAYFTGTIITDSIIEASELKTATITGIGKDKQKDVGLTIKNLKNAINFVGVEEDENGKEKNELSLFKLGADKIESKLFFDSEKPIYSPLIYSSTSNTSMPAMASGRIGFINRDNNGQITDNKETFKAYFQYNDSTNSLEYCNVLGEVTNQPLFTISTGSSTEERQTILNNIITTVQGNESRLNTPDIYIMKGYSSSLHYTKNGITGGYDLFVESGV